MNIQRFREVLQYIEAHPLEWDQASTWRCFFAIGNKVLGVERQSIWDEAWLMFGIDTTVPNGRHMMMWMYGNYRTLDDFRTVARRSFA